MDENKCVNKDYVDNSAYVKNTTLYGKAFIYNSESQYILFKNEFVNPPIVNISIIGKPNNDGNIYISKVDNFGFEIRSNRDRLYDIAGEINYIVNGDMYLSTDQTIKYAKVDRLTGDILGISSRKQHMFRTFSIKAFKKFSLNNKLVVSKDALSTDDIIDEDDLVVKEQSLHNAKLSIKNKLKHELDGMINFGFKTKYGRIPFTKDDKILLLEALVTTDGIRPIVFSNELSVALSEDDIMTLYRDLLDKEFYLNSKYRVLCSKIDVDEDINNLNNYYMDSDI